MEYEIRTYETNMGKRPFTEWLNCLKDPLAKAKIRIRLDRMSMGNFGDCKSLGEGVSELKIDIGPGYRIYFGKIGNKCVLLLGGGTKNSQQKDIERAKQFFEEFQENKEIYGQK